MGRIIAIHQGPDGRHRPGPPKRDDRFLPVVEFTLTNDRLNIPTLVPLEHTPDRDSAESVRRSLYMAARYYCSCGGRNCARRNPNVPSRGNPDGGCPDGGRRVGCRADLVMHRGKLRVQFSFYDKREAMRQVIASYGPDPSKWPYNPRAKQLRK